MTLTISYVGPDRRDIALRLLFARFPLEEQQSRRDDALRSAESGSLNLNGLLLAEEHGCALGASLYMHQPDGVTLVWPPVVSCQASDVATVEKELMQKMCIEIDNGDSRLAQALLSPDDQNEIELLNRHQFEHLSDMFFLVRPLTETDLALASNDGEFDHETFTEANAGRFASVIERTYQASLDCPFLDGLRNGNDALFSHRLSGRYDPAGWRLYRIGSQDVGVLMMNEHPDQNAIELVYFGIVPEFRGRGLGRKVLRDGVQAASLTGRIVMFLAVDCANTYANALYGELEFTELARRCIMVRRFGRLARK